MRSARHLASRAVNHRVWSAHIQLQDLETAVTVVKDLHDGVLQLQQLQHRKIKQNMLDIVDHGTSSASKTRSNRVGVGSNPLFQCMIKPRCNA